MTRTPNTPTRAPAPGATPQTGLATRAAVIDGEALATRPEQAGQLAATQREESEIKAAVWLAQANPRDEPAACAKIVRSCRRPTFAEGATYKFPRGNATVTGPSVDLARELARCWGNIRYGVRVVRQDGENIHIKGYAYDLEANTYVEQEDEFAKLVQRKNKVTGVTVWTKPDERDLRELVNKRGAICIRNAILQLIPPDITDDALSECAQTLNDQAEGNLAQDRDRTVRQLVVAYSDLGVTKAMLDAYLGHDAAQFTPGEYTALKGIYASIRDGNSQITEHFVQQQQNQKPAEQKPPAGTRQEELAKKVHEATTPPAATAETKPPPPEEEAPAKPDPNEVADQFVASMAPARLRGWVLAQRSVNRPRFDAAVEMAGFKQLSAAASDEHMVQVALNIAFAMVAAGENPTS